MERREIAGLGVVLLWESKRSQGSLVVDFVWLWVGFFWDLGVDGLVVGVFSFLCYTTGYAYVRVTPQSVMISYRYICRTQAISISLTFVRFRVGPTQLPASPSDVRARFFVRYERTALETHTQAVWILCHPCYAPPGFHQQTFYEDVMGLALRVNPQVIVTFAFHVA
jgi:hypothetical protein